MASSIFSGLVTQVDSENPITVTTNLKTYLPHFGVEVSGTIENDIIRLGQAVLISIINPRNETYRTDLVDVMPDGSYVYEFGIEGELGIEGNYRVEVSYLDKYFAETSFLFQTPVFTCSDLQYFIGVPNTYSIKVGNKTFQGRYIGSIANITASIETTALDLVVPENIACLDIELPRELIDAQENAADKGYLVLVDGMQTSYIEHQTDISRDLQIQLPSEGTKYVEIVGTKMIPEFSLLILTATIGISVSVVLALSSRIGR